MRRAAIAKLFARESPQSPNFTGWVIDWWAGWRAQAEGVAQVGAHRAAAVAKEVNVRLGRLGQAFDVVLDQVRTDWR